MQKIAAFLIIFMCLGATNTYAQKDKQAQLERKRQEILSEIKKIEVVLFKTQGEKKSVLNEVADVNQRLQARERLIKITNQQANYLTRTINANMQEVDNLRKELKTLKEDYAAMIRKSYKSKSQQSRVMFLLSSESFLQVYKRVQYMKQYADYRRKQGEDIKAKTAQLQQINKDLIEQRKDKDALIAENKKERAKLVDEKKSQEALVATLKKNEGKFAAQIRKKQRAAEKIDKEIDALVRAEIAKANKVATNTTKATTGNKNVTKNSTTFNMTPEAKKLASSFSSNKGKLPWPVTQGVVTGKYGEHSHSQFSGIKRKSTGVEIATAKDEDVRAVFDGEVIQIQRVKGANASVMIRHGNYLTIYMNVIKLKVKKGDKVTTKQNIGKVGRSALAGKPQLKFYIYKDDKKMNPADWVYRM